MEQVSTITALLLCASLKEKCESCSSLERKVVGMCSSGVRWTLHATSPSRSPELSVLCWQRREGEDLQWHYIGCLL